MAMAIGPGRTTVGAQGADGQVYRPPVDAAVIDPFRPPSVPWGPGNRGLEYATAPGTSVRAIGPGVVTFAGPVAGSLHVTVAHPDGLRSSYSGVAAIRVVQGESVDGGQPVAVSAEGLHLGVRRGERYVDPAGLWGLGVESGPVVLVPVDEPWPQEGPSRHPSTRSIEAIRAAAAELLARLPLVPWVR